MTNKNGQIISSSSSTGLQTSFKVLVVEILLLVFVYILTVMIPQIDVVEPEPTV